MHIGYRPTKGAQVSRISCQSISPEEFFATYVAQRRPVVIEGLLNQPDVRFSAWSNEYLIKRAGAAIVQIEEKGASGSFGTGKQRLRMPFGDFVKKLDAGVDNLYLTTQYDEGEDETPRLSDLLPAPVSHLLGDFPLSPALLPTLVPQQINMWMGHSRSGTSSGLHCDYHDNLYHLVRGSKRFLLFAPSDAPNVYLHGELVRIHPNGLIAFEKGIRSDGAPIDQVVRWHSAEAERQLAERRKRGEASKRDEEDAEDAEADEALEAALGGAEDEWADDFAALAGEVQDTDEEQHPTKARKRKGNESKKRENKKKAAEKAASNNSTEPPSFSRVDPITLQSLLRSPVFPRLADACRMEVELREGDALYLPASWLHCVESCSANSGSHLAFNYWYEGGIHACMRCVSLKHLPFCRFHPPSTSSFASPYDDNFWASRFESLKSQIK